MSLKLKVWLILGMAMTVLTAIVAVSVRAMEPRSQAEMHAQALAPRGSTSIRLPGEAGRRPTLSHDQSEISGLAAPLLALLISLGLLFNRGLTRRILGLHAASRRLAQGDYGVRLAADGSDEIGELERGFNAMAGAIEQRESALQESKEQYRILADHSSEWESWLGPDGRYRYVSPACATISGHGPEEFLADPGLMERLLHPDDLAAWRDHVQDPPQPELHAHVLLPLRLRARDGSYRRIEHTCVTLFDAAGRYLGRRGVNRDITERKRAEELERYNAFQAGIAEMSTAMLHNIGNAITAVTQDAEIIEHAGAELLQVAALLQANAAHSQQDLADPATSIPELAQRQCAIQNEAARAIRRLSEDDLRQRSRRLGESVRHIADIVRIRQSTALADGQRSTFSLSQAIRSALEMQGAACAKHGIEVAVEVNPAVDQVTLSHNSLLQALVNVIKNSVEAIRERGQSPGFRGRLAIRAEPLGDDRLRLTLEDNGVGFDPNIRDSLFRFGYSTKRRGTGFGLHSVAVFAQESDGRVALESRGRGQGARFVLELPLTFQKPAPKVAPPAAAAAGNGSKP